jgi:TPR repeat protein
MNDSDEASKLPISDNQLSAIAQWASLTSIGSLQIGGDFGDESGSERYALAYLMDLGCVDPVSAQQVFRLYESAAKSSLPEAMLAAGHYLEHGIGVEPDVEAAIEWYRKAGQAGCECGDILAYSLGGQARDLVNAASLGDMSAMLRLAKEKLDAACQFRSPWGETDYERESFESALFWYDCASNDGSLDATLLLAKIHDDSWHTRPPEGWSCQSSTGDRLARALEYYERAGELGWEFAAQNIERIQKRLDAHDAEPDWNDE